MFCGKVELKISTAFYVTLLKNELVLNIYWRAKSKLLQANINT